METVLVKCIQGEKVCSGVQEYITIDRVDLLFVDSNLNSEKLSLEYPKTSNKSSNGKSMIGGTSFDEMSCGKINPIFTNIEIEQTNKRLKNLLYGVDTILTQDKTSEFFLNYFTNQSDTIIIPIGYASSKK